MRWHKEQTRHSQLQLSEGRPAEIGPVVIAPRTAPSSFPPRLSQHRGEGLAEQAERKTERAEKRLGQEVTEHNALKKSVMDRAIAYWNVLPSYVTNKKYMAAPRGTRDGEGLPTWTGQKHTARDEAGPDTTTLLLRPDNDPQLQRPCLHAFE
ncbi:hypothetical protein EYF80_004533 [Liparis tanakae]|uniref:Uncharacterized protein n=1 Tax=Liparis tanakae TaxID=230148 RepID=A0A4Z2J6K5_9TELE|nr:hypothetical protein EYF80_004533 [Liparis tanakae]